MNYGLLAAILFALAFWAGIIAVVAIVNVPLY